MEPHPSKETIVIVFDTLALFVIAFLLYRAMRILFFEDVLRVAVRGWEDMGKYHTYKRGSEDFLLNSRRLAVWRLIGALIIALVYFLPRMLFV